MIGVWAFAFLNVISAILGLEYGIPIVSVANGFIAGILTAAILVDWYERDF